MDDIGSTNQHYKNISNLSVAVLLLCVVAYLRIVAVGVDLLEFTFIEDELMRSLAQIAVEVSYLLCCLEEKQQGQLGARRMVAHPR